MEPGDNAAAEAVADACGAAVALAAMGGIDVVTDSPEIRLQFGEGGDITVSTYLDGEEVDSGVVASSDIEQHLAGGSEPEAPAPEAPKPPPAQ